VIQGTLHDYFGGTPTRFEPKPGFDEEIIRQTAGSAREGFAWAFRHAALLILSVLPLMGALRRTPAQARAEFMAQMQARREAEGGAPPGAGPPGAGPPGSGPPGNGPPGKEPPGSEPPGDGQAPAGERPAPATS
jgi:hypothetical protein